MPKFYGNTSTSAVSTAYDNPLNIVSFKLVNKSGGGITVNASIIFGSTNIWLTPLNKSLAAGEIYESDNFVKLLSGEQIYILVSGSCDYTFTLSNESE